ncbi:N-formylglutamate amidohydrolase [Rhizobium nepotum]|uniref:N-formylglutamate amidohydrolase n=1 Tax=Rhizobium nepotum TaxID=1035271 RepID=UPI003CEE32FF
MSIAEARTRIATYWQPYHHYLAALLNAVYARFGRVYHINCHSIPLAKQPRSRNFLRSRRNRASRYLPR